MIEKWYFILTGASIYIISIIINYKRGSPINEAYIW